MDSTIQTRNYCLKSTAECRNLAGGRFYSLSIWLRDHVVLASLIILMCSVAPRLFLTAVADPSDLIKPDSGTYLTPAFNLLEHGAFLNSDKKPEVSRTPGYPVFVAAIMSLVGQDLRKVLITQTVILSCSVLFLYWLARLILPPVMAFTGGMLAAFSPWGAVLAGLPLTEGLFVFVLALIFLLMNLVMRAGKVALAVWGSAAVGLLTAAAVFIRPIWPLVLIISGALFLQYGVRRRGAWLVLAVMVVSASTPLFMWKARNMQEAGFHGLSDISGKAAWRYHASRVKAQVDDADRWTIVRAAVLDEGKWDLSVQEADDERWRRAKAVFREHPVLTVYSFVRSAAEHMVHPSPDILASARLNFYGDYLVLALLWGGFLVLSYLGWGCTPDCVWDNGSIDRGWLFTLLVICLLLTLASGMSFGGGSRLRAPLELIVPLLAAVGLVRVVRSFQRVKIPSIQESPPSAGGQARPVLAVLIPIYNEAHTIEALFRRILASPVDMELRLFVVDDHSSDSSGAILDRLASGDPRITVLHHPVNRGKGAAIRTAIDAAEGDFAIIQDADFEYDPADYPRIAAPLLRGDTEAVFGSRYLNGNERRVLHYWHSLGNALLTTFFNIVHNMHLTDMETCYKAMPLKLLKSLRLTTDRFGIEPEIAARLIAVRARIIEVPISYSPRGYQDGKKIGWRDALEAFYCIIKFKYFDAVPCVDAGMVRHLAMAEAPRYQQAIAREIQPYLGERVIEVGAGIGNLARHLAYGKQLVLTEPTPEYRRQLAASMNYRSNVTISDRDVLSEEGLAWAKIQYPDTILCLNQLEQVGDDKRALDSLAAAIKPGGRVILVVSAHAFLYGSLDEALRRQRRYTAERIAALVEGVGLYVEHQKWLGKLVLVGWFMESKVWRRRFFAPKPVTLVNVFSPLMGILDRWLPWKGLSLLVVARRPA
jgi:glycosyltransferase involved in cell wall biosynthesis/phospholipid N-methyltransferase